MNLFPIKTLERYDAKNRALVHSIKIGRSQYELRKSIPGLVAKAAPLIWGVERVMPAPSSLYSRVMGRIDLAYYFASQLEAAIGCQLQRAPSHLHWRWNKRSRLKNRLPPLSWQARSQNNGQARLLIVDDVITTGTTLVEVAQATGVDFDQISALVLFDARPRTRQHSFSTPESR
jgi:predicted amidophosphoribosyltransferase